MYIVRQLSLDFLRFKLSENTRPVHGLSLDRLGGGGFSEKHVFKFEVKRKCPKARTEKKAPHHLHLIGAVLLVEEIRKKKWSTNDIRRTTLRDFCLRYLKFRSFNNKVNLVHVFGESQRNGIVEQWVL